MSARFHRQCLAEICTRIKQLGLEGLSADEVKVRRQPFRKSGDRTLIPHRGVTIHRIKPVQQAGTNRSEDIGYGCGITTFKGADHSESVGPEQDWEEIIRRAFINQRLANVTPFKGHVCISTVEHGDWSEEFDDHEYEIGMLLIRVWARETRS
jgi:hypothetical protein